MSALTWQLQKAFAPLLQLTPLLLLHLHVASLSSLQRPACLPCVLPAWCCAWLVHCCQPLPSC